MQTDERVQLGPIHCVVFLPNSLKVVVWDRRQHHDQRPEISYILEAIPKPKDHNAKVSERYIATIVGLVPFHRHSGIGIRSGLFVAMNRLFTLAFWNWNCSRSSTQHPHLSPVHEDGPFPHCFELVFFSSFTFLSDSLTALELPSFQSLPSIVTFL